MSDDNVLSLAAHLKSNKPLPTMDGNEEAFSLAAEKTLLRRLFAFACDFFCVLTIYNMVSVSYAVFVGNFLLPLSNIQKTEMIQPGFAFVMTVFMVVFFSYFFYCNYILDGKTLGSVLMKLRVIDDNYPFDQDQESGSPSLNQVFKRTLGYLICYMSFGSFFFFSLLNEEKRGVPDFLSGTRVVSDEWLRGFSAYRKFNREQVRININSLDKAA